MERISALVHGLCWVGVLFSAANAADASILVSVCNQDMNHCTTNATGDLISIGDSGSGINNTHDYSWEYGAAAQVKTTGDLVPELGVSASLSEYRSGFINSLLPTYNRRVFAMAGISDGLNIANVGTGTVNFTVDIDGTAGFTLSDALTGVDLVSPQFGNTTVWQGSTLPQYSVPLTNSITLTAPFSDNRLDYSLTLEAAFYCSYFFGALCTGDDAHPSNYNNFGDGSAFADFLNTATITNVQVYNALGQLVGDPGITSDAAYVYPVNNANIVPEPATLGTAFVTLGLILAARNMRRYTA